MQEKPEESDSGIRQLLGVRVSASSLLLTQRTEDVPLFKPRRVPGTSSARLGYRDSLAERIHKSR